MTMTGLPWIRTYKKQDTKWGMVGKILSREGAFSKAIFLIAIVQSVLL
jgi:hypothetical protein